MQYTTCPNCNTPVPAEALFCPECGLAFSPEGTVALQPAAAGNRPVFNSSNTFGPIEQTKFFHLFDSFINTMENSLFFKKPLRWLYILFAVLNILVPVFLLFKLISNDMLNGMGFGGMMIWLVFAFAGWVGFQLWWNRKDKIDIYYRKGDDFFAIPLFSHYIQTTGEWLGITIAILGAGLSLVAWIFFNGDGSNSRMPFPLPLQSLGIAGIIVSPILGFTIVLITRVAAELYRALSAIANNTAQTAARR